MKQGLIYVEDVGTPLMKKMGYSFCITIGGQNPLIRGYLVDEDNIDSLISLLLEREVFASRNFRERTAWRV